MKYYFNEGVNEQEFFYAWSPQSRVDSKFSKGDGFIVNKAMPVEDESKRTYNDYEHISILTKKKYGIGVTVTLECDFEVFGAPLLLFTNDLMTLNGKQSYDRHVEIVGYEEGFNVWDITYLPNRPDKRFIAPIKTAFKKFKIENNERIFITAKFLQDGIYVTVNGESLMVNLPNMPKEFHVGLTACEGINRFYSLEIE